MLTPKATAIVRNVIKQEDLIPDNSTIIVGLSGGPDSVFLLHILANMRKEKNLKLVAAHLDHGWRPESTNDAQFSQEISQKYDIPIVVKKMAELEIEFKPNGSKEEIGRKARRYFFESVAKKYNATAIALAHHRDDQCETFFIRLMRGASLSGLTGIKSKEGLYIRPLLDIKKNDILNHLQQEGIPYITDASNTSDDYLRNRIRNTVIPALQKCDSRFDRNFISTHNQLQQTEEFLQELSAITFAHITDNDNGIIITHLLALHSVLRVRIIIQWICTSKVSFRPSKALFDEIIRFLEQPNNGQHIFYQKWLIKKVNGKAFIETIQ